jgi:antitoxin component YwqK of YwqJK toxin-antitoxin module
MKKWKYWAGAAVLALGAYAFWPGSEPKVEEPVKVEKEVERKHKIDFNRINEVVNQNKSQEINLKEVLENIIEEVEESDLPSCLRCGDEDWRPKIKREWYDQEKTIKKSEETLACGVLHGPWKAWYPNGQLKEIGEGFCGKPKGRYIELDKNGIKTNESVYDKNGEKIRETYFRINQTIFHEIEYNGRYPTKLIFYHPNGLLGGEIHYRRCDHYDANPKCIKKKIMYSKDGTVRRITKNDKEGNEIYHWEK